MEMKTKRRLGVRALSLLLLFALLLGTASSALALTKNETVYSTALINVRSGPGTNYSVVGKLKVNDQVKYLGASGSWAKIEYNGTVAYAFAKYLKSAGSTTSGDKLYATTGVNVRSGPGTSYAKLGTLTKDQQVTKLGSSGKWMKIAYGSGYAYVHGQYLTATEPDNIDDTSSGNSGLTALVTLYNTPVYAGPGLAYGTLYVVNAGTTVYATGVISGDYTQVQTSTGVGYIQSSVLKGSVTPVQSPGTITTQTYAYIQASYSLGYYTTPLAVGTTVTCTGVVSNGFVQIVYGTGFAYVPQNNVRVGATNSGGTTNGTYQRYVTQSTLVYQTVDAGGVASGLVATLSANTLVTCVSTIGNYTKIIFGLDYGFVLTANLTTGGTTSLPGYGNNTIKTDTAVYAEPRSGAAVLGFAYRNQAVYCTGVVIGEYAQVLISTNTYGYIATSCLTLTVTPSGGVGNLGVRRLASGSALYTQAYGTSANLVGILTVATNVTLISIVGTWSQILLNGTYYYTLSSNLTTI